MAGASATFRPTARPPSTAISVTARDRKISPPSSETFSPRTSKTSPKLPSGYTSISFDSPLPRDANLVCTLPQIQAIVTWS